jgi:O-antigen/teichoic acid export membrane protein
LIPQYGIEGAAVATTAALIFESAVLYAVAKRRLGFHVSILGKKID